MLSIDFKNAITGTADNFTCALLRLMLKSDNTNLAKLGKSYPIEAEMVRIFHNGPCPMAAGNEVDYNELERRAIAQVSNKEWKDREQE